MARGEASESQNSTFTGGINGGGGGRSLIVSGRKIDTSVGEMVVDAEIDASVDKPGVGVRVTVVSAVVMMSVGYNVSVGDRVSVIIGYVSGVGVLEGAIEGVSGVIECGVSSVGN